MFMVRALEAIGCRPPELAAPNLSVISRQVVAVLASELLLLLLNPGPIRWGTWRRAAPQPTVQS